MLAFLIVTLSMKVKAPTTADYDSYDGAHCHQLWKQLPKSWRCPGCNRLKFEILRWTTRYFKSGIGKCDPYKGWMAGLHRHHDHNQEFLDTKGRFEMTIICDQCNAADGAAKRILNLPTSFSFSPMEIGIFVKPVPHGRHKLDFEKARAVYKTLLLCDK